MSLVFHSITLDTAFALGAFSPYHNHFEVLDLKSWSWESRPDYPFHSSLQRHANIVYNGNFFVFGGDTDKNGDYSTVIAKFDVSQNRWSKLGDLVSARCAHDVILSDGYFMVLGQKATEKCTLSDNSMSCIQQDPTVSDHLNLFHVAEDFCQT